MKKLVLATALALVAVNAVAGGYEPVAEETAIITPMLIEEEMVSSNGGVMVPLMAVIMFAVAIAG